MDWKILIAVIGALVVFFFARQCTEQTKPDYDKVRQLELAERQTEIDQDKAQKALDTKRRGQETARKERGERPAPQLASLETREFRATFTTRGGALKSLALKDPQYLEEPRDWSTGLRDEKPKKYTPVDLVTTNTDAFELSTPLRFEIYESKGLEALLPDADYALAEKTRRSVTFRLDQPAVPVDIVKKFEIADRPGPFQLWLTVRVTNRGNAPITFRGGVVQHGYQHQTEATGSIFSKQPNLMQGYCYYDGEIAALPWNGKDLAKPFTGIGEIGFVGVGTNYFLGAMIPVGVAKASCRIANMLDNPALYPTLESQPWGHVAAELRFAEVSLGPGESKLFKIKNYLGPKRFKLLQSLGHGIEKSVDYGWLAPICQLLLAMLFFFQSHVGNWGLAVILLTVVVKVVLMPLTNRSFRSMEKMKALKPEVDKINEKFKDNAQEKQQAIMALYKQQGVNPLGGCLPTLLQMPIWFALYRMLRASPELYRAPFYGWIQDLSSPDPYFVTPVVMGVMMYVQQRLTPMTGDPMQVKMMLYFMPIMFTAMMLFLPSGLTLYILVNSVLSILHQSIISKRSMAAQGSGKIQARHP